MKKQTENMRKTEVITLEMEQNMQKTRQNMTSIYFGKPEINEKPSSLL